MDDDVMLVSERRIAEDRRVLYALKAPGGLRTVLPRLSAE